MFSPNVNNTIKNRLPLGSRFYEFVVSYSFFIIPQGSSPCVKLIMSSSMGHLLYYNFLRLSVASIILQEFLFVHCLTLLSTRSASGFLLQLNGRLIDTRPSVFVLSARSVTARQKHIISFQIFFCSGVLTKKSRAFFKDAGFYIFREDRIFRNRALLRRYFLRRRDCTSTFLFPRLSRPKYRC